MRLWRILSRPPYSILKVFFLCVYHIIVYTVNVYIFVQYIFSCILHRAVDVRKYDVSEKMKYYSANRINCYMDETLSMGKYQQGLAERKYRCAEISTSTVCLNPTFPGYIHFICCRIDTGFMVDKGFRNMPLMSEHANSKIMF